MSSDFQPENYLQTVFSKLNELEISLYTPLKRSAGEYELEFK
jgi:hypothetical protein